MSRIDVSANEVASMPLDPVLQAITSQLATIVEVARGAATTTGDLSSAVHDVRKALRRARSIVDLVRGILPRSEHREVREMLRTARRRLSATRDRAVVESVLADVPLDEEARTLANQMIATDSAAAPTAAQIRESLLEVAVSVSSQVSRVQANLPAELDHRALIQGWCDVYRKARRARRAAKHGKAAFHTWRRRTKESSYQLEALAGLADVKALASEMESANELQGPVADLLMLRSFVRRHRDLDRQQSVRVLEAISTQLAPMMKAARKRSRDTFRPKPRQLRRDLERAFVAKAAQPEPD